MMQTISENDLYHRLAFDNPWWEFRENTKINFRKPPRRSQFDAFVKFVKSEAAHLKILAGPLRAGKTVILKQLISGIIETGMPSNQIFYCSFATPSYAAADPVALVDMFCEQHRHKPSTSLLIIFDEAQYIKNWRETLLQLQERHPGAKIIGSISADAPIQISGAQITGELEKSGSFEVFVLPPLTFAEFLRFRETEEKIFIKSTGSGKPSGRMMLRQNAMNALNEEFHRYINYGGFLEGVLSSKGGGVPAPSFIRDGAADRVLHKDLCSVQGINDPGDLNKLFCLIAYNTAREFSVDDLAKATGIAKNTVRKYLDFLEQAFLIWRIPRVNRMGKRFERAVAFKIYLTTPCRKSVV